jgi:hypothetical protein
MKSLAKQCVVFAKLLGTIAYESCMAPQSATVFMVDPQGKILTARHRLDSFWDKSLPGVSSQPRGQRGGLHPVNA